MKTIILTGFTSGLGLALYNRLLTLVGEEFKLICIGRNIARVNKVQGVSYFELDLSELQNWSTVITDIDSDSSELIFISNASVIDPISRVGELESNFLIRANHVNYLNPALLVNELIGASLGLNAKLEIVNISSGAATKAISGWAAYCSTKAAFKMFLDVLVTDSIENVDVQHIDPGVIDTGMQKAIRCKDSSQMRDVEYFKELQSAGKLKSASDASNEIMCKVGLS